MTDGEKFGAHLGWVIGIVGFSIALTCTIFDASWWSVFWTIFFGIGTFVPIYGINNKKEN